MTYVDHHTGNVGIAQNQHYFPHVRSGIAAFRNLLTGAFSALSSFLAYLATAHGPTPSASALIYGGIATAGAIFYEAWNVNSAAAGYPSRGLLCERGCLRRFASDLHLKTLDEIRLHQGMFDRRFKYRYVTGPG
ncbi:hypothetical protein HYPDE_32283 [Hyphomicrobium denitrificans 1NES1]|uniref:Uncharacterized protein n=1 Tax=Hyphomicrobium denitrificans 1NES1 TaxID=670307 RepID=N0BDB7_9HYPH|nr:hypothetical protein [Hyphomicrobium denitrificans]AGK58130.1 hypothetical protein HYPDE_32283 [Hyphomicrobium denitrificans 1NES1]